MSKRKIACKYLTKEICSAIFENNEAKEARTLNCENNQKLYCCYLCSSQGTCEISCNFLDKKKGTNDTLNWEPDQRPLIKCNFCKIDMRSCEIKFRTGGMKGIWQAFLGETAQLDEELLPVTVYLCPSCGRMELIAEDKTKQKLLKLSE